MRNIPSPVLGDLDVQQLAEALSRVATPATRGEITVYAILIAILLIIIVVLVCVGIKLLKFVFAQVSEHMKIIAANTASNDRIVDGQDRVVASNNRVAEALSFLVGEAHDFSRTQQLAVLRGHLGKKAKDG